MVSSIPLQLLQVSYLGYGGMHEVGVTTFPTSWIGGTTTSRTEWCLKNVFCKLREDGVGAVVKHAAVVTPKEEDLFWTSGVIGTSWPLTLRCCFCAGFLLFFAAFVCIYYDLGCFACVLLLLLFLRM